MHDLLLRRLELYVEISASERRAIHHLCSNIPKHIQARRLIIDEGEECRSIPYLMGGWACSYKLLEDGRCQNLSFFLPGDLWDFSAPAGSRMAHALRTIKDSILIDIPRDRFFEVVADHPGLAEAFRWLGMATAATSREWIISLGQRTSKERCAHMICELYWRLRAVGLVDGASMDFPFTQEEVGNTIGVSTVHANRMLQDLRADNLIRQSRRRLQVLDLEQLEHLALFDPNFLHVRAAGNEPTGLPRRRHGASATQPSLPA